MEVISRFFRQSMMSYKALFGFLSPKIYILVKVINPIFQLIFFSLLASYVYQTDDVTPWLIGNAFLLSMFNSLFGVGTVMANERQFGTLTSIIASPSNHFLIFVGRAFMHIIDASSTVLIGFAVGYIFFGIDFSQTNFLMLFITIFISMYAAMGIGLLIGSIGLIVKDMNLILNTVSMGFMILTGANFPLSELPYFIQYISYSIPITRSIEAGRLIVAGGGSTSLFTLMVKEVMIGTIYIIIGYYLLKVLERKAREGADMDLY